MANLHSGKNFSFKASQRIRPAQKANVSRSNSMSQTLVVADYCDFADNRGRRIRAPTAAAGKVIEDLVPSDGTPIMPDPGVQSHQCGLVAATELFRPKRRGAFKLEA